MDVDAGHRTLTVILPLSGGYTFAEATYPMILGSGFSTIFLNLRDRLSSYLAPAWISNSALLSTSKYPLF